MNNDSESDTNTITNNIEAATLTHSIEYVITVLSLLRIDLTLTEGARENKSQPSPAASTQHKKVVFWPA